VRGSQGLLKSRKEAKHIKLKDAKETIYKPERGYKEK
jgi:hypothetical protein